MEWTFSDNASSIIYHRFKIAYFIGLVPFPQLFFTLPCMTIYTIMFDKG